MVSINSHFTALETLLERECVPDHNGRYNYNEVFGSGFMQWKKKYLSYDQSCGWSIVQLNFFDRIFRYLFGSHPTTHLTFIANHITDIRARITNENQMEAQFLDRMHSCWTRAHPTANPTHSPFMYHVILPPPPLSYSAIRSLTPLTNESNNAPSNEPLSREAINASLTPVNAEPTPEEGVRQLITFGLTDEDIHEFMQGSSLSTIEIQRLINQNRSQSPTIDKELYDLIDELVQDGMSDEEIAILMHGSHLSNNELHNYIERAKASHSHDHFLDSEVSPIPVAGRMSDVPLNPRRVNEPEIPFATENEILETIIECVRSEISDEDIQECLATSGYSQTTIQSLIRRAKNQI